MSLLHTAGLQDGKYQNPVPTTMAGFGEFLKLLPKQFRNKEARVPQQPLGPFTTDPAAFHTPPQSGLRVTWFGHSAFLLEIDGLRVLVDPVWEPRASPFRFLGPRRFFPPTLPLADMPALDAILVSHDHYDHLGAHTMRHLAGLPCTRGARWVTSLGVSKRLRKFGVPADRIQELDWTHSVRVAGSTLGDELEITAVPARHFSGRTPWDRFTTLWSSFILKGPRHNVFYGADTGPWPGFSEIAERYGPFDMTLLEIGAYHPLWGNIHLGPDQAADAYRQMGGPEKAGLFFPIHWGLFNLALHGWQQPITRLSEIAAAEGWPLWQPQPGLPTDVLPHTPVRSAWWQDHASAASVPTGVPLSID